MYVRISAELRLQDAFKAHQQTPHYLRWKDTVTDAMSQPRQGVKHHSLFFDNGE